MKILICKRDVEETELETFLDECQIVIIEDKSGSSKKPMSKIITRIPNIALAVHCLLKGIIKYYILGSIDKAEENGNWILQVPMPAREIAEMFRNTIKYKQ